MWVYRGRMTKDDDALQDAIIEQLNAELGAKGMSVSELARRIGRPYDSTRNYLRGERVMPLSIFLECASAIGVAADVIVSRARDRLQ